MRLRTICLLTASLILKIWRAKRETCEQNTFYVWFFSIWSHTIIKKNDAYTYVITGSVSILAPVFTVMCALFSVTILWGFVAALFTFHTSITWSVHVFATGCVNRREAMISALFHVSLNYFLHECVVCFPDVSTLKNM